MNLLSARACVLVFAGLAVAPLTAQTPAASAPGELECDTVLTPAEVVEVRARQAAGLYDRQTTAANSALLGGGAPSYVVPLTFHVVRTSSGQQGLSQARLDQALLDANLAYAPLSIEFCLVGPVNYIDDDDLYFNINSSAEIDALRSMNPVPGTINVYFTENLNNGSSSICGRSSFSTSAVQGIAMKNSCTGLASNPSTFPHELGHYFDLYHTHSSSMGAECVDGSNCASAGDLVCDTPADPTLGSSNVTSGCAYVGNDTDNCHGDPYAPLPDNFMSYSRKTCRTEFTPGQKNRALATLENIRPELALQICGARVEYACNPAQVNSTGLPAILVVHGTGVIAANDLTLTTVSLPMQQFGYYLNGTQAGSPVTPPGSQGLLCLGGQLGRYNGLAQIMNSGSTGVMAMTLDLTQTPTLGSTVAIQSGQTWHFQLWYRDFVGGASTSNFSPAAAVTFL